nr:TldD/PmbA family protein [bacterium]
MNNLDAFADKLIAAAKKAGLDEAEAYASRSDRFQVTAYKGAIDAYQVSTGQGVSLRVRVGGKIGSAYSESLTDGDIDFLIARAREQAEVLEEEEQPFFEGSGQYRAPQPVSPSLLAYTPAQKMEDVLRLEALCLEDGRVESVQHCTLSTAVKESVLVNSSGLHLTDARGSCMAYAMPMLVRGDEKREGFAFRAGLDPAVFDLETLAQEAVANGADYLGARPCSTGRFPVLFHPYAMCDLIESFSGIFSAENAQHGLSLLRDREGQQIAAPQISLIDDPALEGGLAGCVFDGEGVAAVRKPVIDGGVLRTLLHNRKTAARAGVKTTANAQRYGYTGGIGIAPSNFYLAPGVSTPQDMMAGMGRGLYVCEVSGLHAGCNTVSGDFSLLAKGFWIENGVKAAPVVQVTVAGNFIDMLSHIVSLGNDLIFSPASGSSFGSPTVWVDALAVAGS